MAPHLRHDQTKKIAALPSPSAGGFPLSLRHRFERRAALCGGRANRQGQSDHPAQERADFEIVDRQLNRRLEQTEVEGKAVGASSSSCDEPK